MNVRKESRPSLVTGSSGYIGSALVNSLRRRGLKVTTTARQSPKARIDITIEKNVQQLLRVRPNCIYHLAAKSGVRESWEKPGAYFHTNVNATYYILDTLRSYDKRGEVPFVFASSSSVYGKSVPKVISEDSMLRPVSPYAASKFCAEALCTSHHSVFGLSTLIARPFYVTGAGCRRGVVYEMANQVVVAEASRRGKIRVTDPSVVLDIVDVEDCVDALQVLAEEGTYGDAYNIASGEGRSVGEIAELLASLSTAKITVEHTGNGGRPNDTPRLVGDPSKLEGLGWRRRYRFRDTIASALDSCRISVNAGTQAQQLTCVNRHLS